MAVKNIAVTDTLETFRTTFNELCADDFGDIANLSGSIVATNLVDAMNETISIATSTAGWTIEDSSSTQQIIGGGNILRVLGSSNEIEAVVSATDTLTIGLPNAVSVTTSLTAPNLSTGTLSITNGSITDSNGTISFGDENLTTTGTVTAANFVNTGTTSTLGTIEISGNTIRSVDSTEVNINDGLRIQGTLKTNAINPRSGSDVDFGSSNLTTSGSFYTSNGSGGIIFEGSTPDGFETTIAATDPTADRTITIPNETGTLITTGSIDAVTEDMMANDSISSAELKAVVQLVIYNSSGVAVKTLYGAGS
ncbi:hypothetical protein CMO86_02240 [Candidatus Woesearchaeota archaeon]|nr:hypothetical protein [Candidatus Woesearchaeota archaeon]